MNCGSWFVDRTAILATMHRKESVMAPILEQGLGLRVVVPDGLDTDRFGTFTREIERSGSQLEAARQKAHYTMELTGATLAIASEGAFFPHPACPWLSSNRELVLLVDRQHGLEIVGETVTTETNFAHRSVASAADALDFAQTVGFPEHGLVVMPKPEWPTAAQRFKGIRHPDQLVQAVTDLLAAGFGSVHVETDMRAMHNPTRMKAIAEATQQLVKTALHQCPNCSYPGFAIVAHEQGLPCAWCQLPTSVVKLARRQCQHCRFTQDEMFPNGITVADPTWCSHCNP